jgi:xanthine dehydrogenase small subunit
MTLSGNLCRCTGYRPILDAGQAMFDAPPGPAGSRPAMRRAARAAGRSTAAPPGFHAPRTLADFAALRLALPQARVLAGSTDMGLWVTKQLRDPGELIDHHRRGRIEAPHRAHDDGMLHRRRASWRTPGPRWPPSGRRCAK